MKIVEQVPGMDDEQLANLRSNARRLAASGNDKQKVAAAAVLEAATLEIDARQAAKRKAQAERRAATAAAGKPRRKESPSA